MRRDMDLVRRILIAMEESDDGVVDGEALVSDAHDLRSVAYHFAIMQQAGFLTAMVGDTVTGEVQSAFADGLTWQGQDFLASIRSDKVWAKMKLALRKSIGSASWETIRSVGVKLGTAALEAQLGI